MGLSHKFRVSHLMPDIQLTLSIQLKEWDCLYQQNWGKHKSGNPNRYQREKISIPSMICIKDTKYIINIRHRIWRATVTNWTEFVWFTSEACGSYNIRTLFKIGSTLRRNLKTSLEECIIKNCAYKIHVVESFVVVGIFSRLYGIKRNTLSEQNQYKTTFHNYRQTKIIWYIHCQSWQCPTYIHTKSGLKLNWMHKCYILFQF